MEKCQKNRKLIWLAIYNELSSEQKNLLENHLQTCSECQLDYEEATRLKKSLDEKIQITPTAAQLESSRAELHQRLLLLSQPRFQKSWFDKAWQIVSLDFAPTWRFATAVALLIFGILIGNFYTGKATKESNFYQQQISELLESNISNIESVKYDPVTRQVAIELNTLNDVTIRGDIEKPEIQQLLAHSIMFEERPNIRLKSVRALEQTKSLNDNSIRALSELIDKEENPGIRLKAVKLLASIPITPSIKGMLAQILGRVLLNDSNSAIRIEAFKGLSKIGNGSIVPVLFDAAKHDSSEFIRAKAKLMLDRTENPVYP